MINKTEAKILKVLMRQSIPIAVNPRLNGSSRDWNSAKSLEEAGLVRIVKGATDYYIYLNYPGKY